MEVHIVRFPIVKVVRDLHYKCQSVFSQVQSAPVQTGRMKILRIKTFNKTNTHLVVEFNDQQQTVFVTNRLLENAFGLKAEECLKEMPLTAVAKIQGSKITELIKM